MLMGMAKLQHGIVTPSNSLYSSYAKVKPELNVSNQHHTGVSSLQSPKDTLTVFYNHHRQTSIQNILFNLD